MRSSPRRPLALVYRGPGATLPGCAESVAALLTRSRWNFDVHYVGPREYLHLTPEILGCAAVYAQPGGDELLPAWRRMRRHRDVVRDYVRGGGRYLGFCLGGYLAGSTPGFDLLPGDTDQYIATPRSEVPGTEARVVDVRWRGRPQPMYFQDGPTFELPHHFTPGMYVLAAYANGEVAALTARFGAGRVGVVGPHPEADDAWFADSGLSTPTDVGTAAGLDLIDAVMS
ncbi:BPL-N domain-containing protein [Rhodococcus sp. Q]|uniref:BPL-N domain-containing protein n=1 Tax=Rhodococcus sp. Q TaxID=2502252 RepID=UPI001BB2B69B|nr:BPL-N domain-containing protein [Rhodococcus sp. Q]